MATDVELAWCAGFFDGEGHVSYRRSYPNASTNKVSPQLICNVPQKSDNIEVLQEFQRITGLGKIKGPYKTRLGRTYHIVSIGTKEVEPLCGLLAKYLKSEKLAAFHVAMYQYWRHDHKPTAEDFARKIKRGVKKGCPECGSKWNGVFCFECRYID